MIFLKKRYTCFYESTRQATYLSYRYNKVFKNYTNDNRYLYMRLLRYTSVI